MVKRKRSVSIPARARYAMAKRMRKPKRQSSLATKVKKLSQIVNKTFEKKTLDVLYDLAIGSGGSVQPVQFALGQGDGDSERVGNKVTLQSVKWDAIYSKGDSFNRMRVLLVEALDGNEQITLDDVLEYDNYQTHGAMVFSSPYTTRTTTDRRYKVHWDQTFEMNSLKNTLVKSGMIKFPKGGKVIHYDDANANPTSFRLTLLHISDSGASPYPLAKLNIRFKYIDA